MRTGKGKLVKPRVLVKGREKQGRIDEEVREIKSK
jgi:hypothetical protein